MVDVGVILHGIVVVLFITAIVVVDIYTPNGMEGTIRICRRSAALGRQITKLLVTICNPSTAIAVVRNTNKRA